MAAGLEQGIGDLTNTSKDLGHEIVERSGSQIDMTFVLDDWAIQLCLVAVSIACFLSGIDMWHHLDRFEHPKLQSGSIRILLMIPVYGVLSWLTLVAPPLRFGLRTVRDTYEAFVLYQFLALLVEYCGGEAQLVQSLERKRYKGIHPMPMCWLPMFPLDQAFFNRCRRWVLQYACLKPIMAIVALVGHPLGLYVESNMNFGSNLYPWVFLVYNVSISWSLWYLVVFHQETERELHYCKPLLKFVCIKSIIFFSYWQSSALAIMLSIGMVYTGETEEEREAVGGCIQEFLICLELVPIAILHHYGFGVAKLEQEMKEHPLYESAAATRGRQTRLERLDEALSLGQFVRDTVDAVFAKRNQLRYGNTGEEEETGAAGAKPTRQGHRFLSRSAWPSNLAKEDDATRACEGSQPSDSTAASVVVEVVHYDDARSTNDGEGDHDQDEEMREIRAPSHSHAVGTTVDRSGATSHSTTIDMTAAPPTTSASFVGRPDTTTASKALNLCEAVATVRHARAVAAPTTTTTSEVLRAATYLEMDGQRAAAAARRAQRTVYLGTGGRGATSAVTDGFRPATAARDVDAAVDEWNDSQEGLSSGSDGSDEVGADVDPHDDAAYTEAAGRRAFRFGLRADDLQIVTKTASMVNRTMQRVLFDTDGSVEAHFCVVCGRSDRAMVQRKSGWKCKACCGQRHNYMRGGAAEGAPPRRPPPPPPAAGPPI